MGEGAVLGVVQPVVSGCAGGVGSVLVGHPFETVKARLQTGVKPAWPGLRGAFAGIAAPLSGQVPFWGSFYLGYSIGTALKWDDSQAAQMFAGSVAGAFSSFMLTPADAVKVQAQIRQTSALTALRETLRSGGLRELFRPLPPTMGRMVPASAVWFWTKEQATERGCSAFVVRAPACPSSSPAPPRSLTLTSAWAGTRRRAGWRGRPSGRPSCRSTRSRPGTRWPLPAPRCVRWCARS